MGLIKADSAPARMQPFSMADIENQAKEILARAQQHADRMEAAAQAQAKKIMKDAHAAGLRGGWTEGWNKGLGEGTKAGREQALGEHRADLASTIQALKAAAERINQSRIELESAASKDVLNLAVSIAERVTKRQGVLDPAVAVNNVMEALKLVLHSSDVRIAIHPKNKNALKEVMPRLKVQWPALEHVELVEDAMLAPGGCRIYTAQGEVDGDLDGQINRVVADLMPERAEVVS
ncbi:MAG TPA: FliH/SctL family protein [Tepidisphaeraceae bacterium]|jgi:flagellar assembly protein FliH|nr:FliH/SctL family protein [Tepidisphaeraceae bacterium]